MRESTRARNASRIGRVAAAGAALFLLAGCATGYSFVQPDVAGSGGYYTGEAPYSGQGYYDEYGAEGYGYYGGTLPYAYYGPGYYGYAPSWSLGFGISSAWNFRGYWGPWYSAGFAGCYSWRCGSHQHRHGHHRDHDHDSRHWRHDEGPSSDVAAAIGERDLSGARMRAMELNAWRRDHYVRAPRQGFTGSFAGIPADPRPMIRPMPAAGSVAGRPVAPAAAPRGWPAPTAFSRVPRAPAPAAVGRAVIMQPAAPPPVQPATRTGAAPAIRIR